MDLKKELRIMVKYILPPEDRDNDVIENYVDTLALINEEYIKQLNIPVSDMLCGSFDADNSTSSATKCKCGREKWEHPKPRN